MTVSQVCAFWPPPCRNTTCGGSSPHFSALIGPDSMRAHRRQRRRRADLFGVLGQQRELVEASQVVVGDLGHGSTLRTAEIQVQSVRIVPTSSMASTAHAPERIDDPHRRGRGLARHGSCSRRRASAHWRPEEATDMWRTLMPAGSAVVACDGPTSSAWRSIWTSTHRAGRRGAADGGLSGVAVSPTHRRRGVLTAPVHRTGCAGWPTIRSPGSRPARRVSTAGLDTAPRRCGVSWRRPA